MCGDGIINMWNVKYAKKNMNRNTLTRSIVPTLAKEKPEQLVSESIRTVRKARSVLIDGIKVLPERGVRKGIAVKKAQSDYRLNALTDTTKITQRRSNKEIRNTVTAGGVTTLGILIGKQSVKYQMFVKGVVLLKILPLTILNLYQEVERMISRTYRSYAENVMQVRGQDEIYM